jgi:hypothetical protein
MFPQRVRQIERRDPFARLGTEIAQGAVVGTAFAVGLALWFAAAHALVLFAAMGGALGGAIIALVVWVGDADLPEDPILPVSARAAGDGT